MLRIEERAIQSGKSSLVVSIPALWRRSKNLKAGDTLIVEIEEDSIRVRTKEDAESPKRETAK